MSDSIPVIIDTDIGEDVDAIAKRGPDTTDVMTQAIAEPRGVGG